MTGDDFISGIVPEPVEIATARPKEFMPWHKPRKQWVRINQWASEVRKLLGERDSEDRKFRYLSLTGDDLLDVRVLRGVCERKKIDLHYLGFNNVGAIDGRRTETELSLSELRDQAGISAMSTVLYDDIESVAASPTIAYQRVRESAPFDAINLDFCDDIAHLNGSRFPRLELMHRLFEIQTSCMPRSWLLFLTTRLDPDTLPVTIADGFDGALKRNFDHNDAFHRRFCRLIFDANDGSLPSLVEARRLRGQRFLRYYVIGLTKWLLHLATSTSPRWNLYLTNVAAYRVMGETPDIVSLVYKCERVHVPPTDGFNLSQMNVVSRRVSPLSELDLAILALNETQAITDVDELLENDGPLFQRTKEQAVRLLKEARYPVDTYEQFLRSGC